MVAGKHPHVSIVLLNYNGKRFVEYWRPLFSLNYPKSRYEIIFVDNGSKDDSGNAFLELAKKFPETRFKIVNLEQNCGYSKANNIGVSKADGKYVVLLSNDIKVSEDWLRNAIEFLESNSRIGAAQSMMYMLDKPSEPDKMGNYIDVFGLNHPFVCSNEVKEVFYSEGAVMFIRKEVIAEADGLFDESYFMFYEDVDFCWRLRLMGYKIVVLPQSVVFHKRGGTISGTLMKTDPIYVFTNTRNRLNTLLKNYSTYNIIRYISASISLEALKGCLLIASGKPDSGLACFRGILSFFRKYDKSLRKRVNVQLRRRVDDKEIMKFMMPADEALRSIFKNVRKLKSEFETA